MRNLLLSLSIFLLLIIRFTAHAQTNTTATVEKRKYTTQRILEDQVIKIDGVFTESAWNIVPWTTDYTENTPDNNTQPSEQTKMKIIYDEKHIYVAFRCFDANPKGIVKRLSRRDGFDGDWIEISFDSYNDDRTAFSFTITAAGVKGDEIITNNTRFDSSWNPIWYVKTHIDSLGWTAEIKIPFTQLRFSKETTQVWGLQSKRRYFRNNERSLWQHIPVNASGFVSEFGELHGLVDLKSQKQFELQPYTVLELDTYEPEAGNPFRDGSDSKISAGLDAKIGVTNNLTLDLTINPDFGQVNADPGAITLDGFEIFYQERRPFFVENKNIFDYSFGGNQDNLFFSRRIGRSPQGTATGSEIAFTDQPENTTILGAAKFSGKTKDGWAIGVLESITDKEFAMVLNNNGQEKEQLVEPLTNYFVARTQKDFNNSNSYIGGVFTATNRQLEPSLNTLHKSAYSVGVDFRHTWKNRDYYIEGSFVGSHVKGSKNAILNTQRSLIHLFQRVDASHVSVDENRTTLTGTGGQVGFGKSGGGVWRYNTGAYWRSPELELNDIGFLRQADDIRHYTNITRVFNVPTSWYRSLNIEYSFQTAFDFEGNYNRSLHDLDLDVNLKNNWVIGIGGTHKPRIYINTYLRGGPRWRYSDENYFYTNIRTDNLKKFSVGIMQFFSQADNNDFSYKQYELSLRYQPFNNLNANLSLEYTHQTNKTQYITESQFNNLPRYILGNIKQDTYSTTFQLNYNINPNLTIQYYGQPFISRGRYADFNFVKNATAEKLADRVTWYKPGQIRETGMGFVIDEDKNGTDDYQFNNPDFAFVQFRSNLVLRWEYIPGSEIFVVWSQGITSSGDALNNFGTILDNQIIKQRPDNTFLIKATYRFNL